MAGKFVVKKGTTGKFRFTLVARNGQVIATSETYNTKAAAMNGIKAVQSTAAGAAVEDQTTKAWADEQARLKAVAKTAKKTVKAVGNVPAAAAAKTAGTAKAVTRTAAKTATKTANAATGTAKTAGRTAQAATKTAARTAKQTARSASR